MYLYTILIFSIRKKVVVDIGYLKGYGEYAGGKPSAYSPYTARPYYQVLQLLGDPTREKQRFLTNILIFVYFFCFELFFLLFVEVTAQFLELTLHLDKHLLLCFWPCNHVFTGIGNNAVDV